MSAALDATTPCLLVLNAGSSSLKAQLFDGRNQRLWKGQTDWRPNDPSSGGAAAVAAATLRTWLLPALAPWSGRLALVGHRVVHGGTTFTAPTRLTAAVRRQLATLVPLAPLHNGPALAVMEALTHWWPALDQWACFDTAFHHTLPPEARTYALPAAWRALGLRRFGFHGLSHQHVSDVLAVPRLISCHLGAGCSLCAIREGRSVATTMGFTPLEGLVMASRSGSVDPGVLLHLLRQGVEPGELDEALNQRSGLLGLSDGLSGSMKELRQAAAAGHGAAALAIAVFRQRLLEGIGAMAACLGGVDGIALTGGIGEHDQALREELAAALGWLGPVQLRVVPADEEGLIARECRAAANAMASTDGGKQPRDGER
ncbi:MAG: acetate/propionate family kinase [Cyanobacteriota bacterium]|jgi:acetate kinase